MRFLGRSGADRVGPGLAEGAYVRRAAIERPDGYAQIAAKYNLQMLKHMTQHKTLKAPSISCRIQTLQSQLQVPHKQHPKAKTCGGNACGAICKRVRATGDLS